MGFSNVLQAVGASPLSTVWRVAARDVPEGRRARREREERERAELAARMNAMEAASKNAGEIADNLSVKLNKVRQATITNEITEIVSGANALNN